MQLKSNIADRVFLLVTALAAWWFTAIFIDPELQYYLQQSAFLSNRLFFLGFAKYPGGIADYISEFIAQFFYFKLFGSFLIVLIALLSGIISGDLVARITEKLSLNYFIGSVYLLLSVILQCNYHYPFYAGVRLFIALVFIWIFILLLLKFHRLRFLYHFLLALLLFYVAGGAALFVFVFSAILIQIRFSGKKIDYLLLPMLAVFAGVLPYLSQKYFFLVNLPLVYQITHSKTPMILTYEPDAILYGLYVLLPILLIIALAFYALSGRSAKKISVNPEKKSHQSGLKGKNKPAVEKTIAGSEQIQEMPKRRFLNSPLVQLSVQFIVILVAAVISLSLRFDKREKTKLLVSFYAANRDWDKVIETAERLPDYDLFSNIEYNRALANKGQLAEGLFNYPQLAGSGGLFVDGAVTSDVPFICSDQYYDLGFMHESQHWTFEAQTIFPNSPRLMKRLVEINLVMGKYELAEKFLLRLNDNMLYRDWVASYQKYIDDTLLVAKDPEFSWKRQCEPLDAFTASNFVPKLGRLLEANPGNTMASGYLISTSLLDGDLGTFIYQISNFRDLKTNPIPKCWDEALALYSYMSGKMPAVNHLRCTFEQQKQLNSFVKAMKPFGNDWQKARVALQKDFGTTYWYYLKCLSPGVTKVQLKKEKFYE